MISIITPVYNGASFIKENIESILSLNIPFEHIIVDGGSTDGTLDILNKYPHIKVIHQTEKKGMYHAIQLGFIEAKGGYVCWVNCDDRIVKEGFEKMYTIATADNIDFISSNGKHLYTHTNKKVLIRGTRFAQYFLKKGFFPFSQPSTLYKKDIVFKVNGFNFEQFKLCGDLELFNKIANIPHVKFKYIDTISSVFLKHGNSLGDLNSDKAKNEYNSLGLSPDLFSRILFHLVRKFHI